MALSNPKIGLGIYTDPKPSARISNGSEFTNPILWVFNGVVGGTQERRLWVGSNDENYAYLGTDGTLSGNDIELSFVDSDNYTDGTRPGWEWKLSAGDTQPTPSQWNSITAGSSIQVGKIYNLFNNGDGGLSQYLPFWLRITVPSLASINMITTVKIRISATRMETGWYTST